MAPVLPRSYRATPLRTYFVREDFGVVAAFALLIYAACVLGIATRPIGLLAAFWPANAIALGFLVRVPRLSSPAGWGAMSAAFIAADLTFGDTIGRTLLLTAGNIVSVAVGYLLFRRIDDGLRRLRLPASVPYLLSVTVVASAAAGCVGAIANPVLFDAPPLRGWFFWFATELVNYIAILPAILLMPLSREGVRKVFALPDHSVLAILPAAALLVSAAAGVFIGGPAAIIFPAPAIIWCAVFYRAFITSLLTFGLSVWTLCAISFGYLEVRFDLNDQDIIISLRLGVALIALAPLAIASLMTARADLMRRLQATNAALTAADEAKDRFLAMMSHELRTPLSGILGMADLLVATGLSKQQQGFAATLSRSAKGLLAMLNDILDFSKIEAGHLQIESAPFLLSEVVNDVRDLFSGTAQEKGLTLTANIPANIQDALIGDEVRLRQVVSNLVNNAIKFTSHGGVTIDVRQESHPEKGLLLHVAVADTGIGIPANDVTRLFRPFVQLDGSRRYGGTGLGLAICRNIVNAMGGEISVVTGEGRGSTFKFFVHMEPDVSGLAAIRADHGKSVKTIVSTSEARPLNVLVADDDQIMRSLIAVMLEREGHQVTVVENGAEAVAAIQRIPFDMVLLDMQMPVMDGLTALRTIRGQESGREDGQENEGGAARGRASVIALSADVRNEQKERIRVAGADVVLGKPIEWERLFAEMRALFLRASLSRAPANAASSPASAARGDSQVLSGDVIENLRVQIGSQTLDRVLRKFADGLQQYVQAIGAALSARDLARVQRIAHGLHGLSAQFGAFEVSTLSSLVARRNCALEQASEIVPQIVIAAGNVREALADKFGIAA